MRIFITGISGLLGLNAALQLKERHEVSGSYLTHPIRGADVSVYPVDLADAAVVEEIFRTKGPEVVLHTAGLTNVDACEANAAEAERQHVAVSDHVARAARSVGAKLVHISTDHLSDGTKAFVTEDSPPAPVNVYARTKWQAEQAATKACPDALIVRTNFFGCGTPFKQSFSDWILAGLKEGRALSLFMDVYITPILINYLVEIIEQLVLRKASGAFNVAGRDRMSKYEFGVRLAREFGYAVPGLRPVSISDASLRASRPRDMSLGTDKVSRVLGRSMPSVADSLSQLKALAGAGWPKRLWDAMPIAGERAAT